MTRAKLTSCWWVLNILYSCIFHWFYIITHKRIREVTFLFISRELVDIIVVLTLVNNKRKINEGIFWSTSGKKYKWNISKAVDGLKGYIPHLFYFSLDISCLFPQTMKSTSFTLRCCWRQTYTNSFRKVQLMQI